MATVSATNGAGTFTPRTVLSPYDAYRVGRNVVHNLIGGGIAVSLVPPNPRSGTVQYLFEVEADAWACLDMHGQATTFSLNDSDRPDVSMTYVVTGEVGISLDTGTLDLWVLSVVYQEVLP